MKIAFDRRKLAETLEILSVARSPMLGSAPRQFQLPVLLTSEGSDVELAVSGEGARLSAVIPALVSEPGAFVLLDGYSLRRIARASEALTVLIEPLFRDTVSIIVDSATYRHATLDPTETTLRPVAFDPAQASAITNPDAFSEALSRAVSVCAKKDDLIIGGVSLYPDRYCGLIITARDGKQQLLAQVVSRVTLSKPVVLSKQTVRAINKVLAKRDKGVAVRINASGDNFQLQAGCVQLAAKILPGDYPDCRQIVDPAIWGNPATRLTGPAGRLVEELRRAAIADPETNRICFSFERNSLRVCVNIEGTLVYEREIHNSDDGISISAEISGTRVYNLRHLCEGLSKFDNDSVVSLDFPKDERPLRITAAAHPHLTYLSSPFPSDNE